MDPLPLTYYSEEARAQALDRYKIIQPFLDGQTPLTTIGRNKMHAKIDPKQKLIIRSYYEMVFRHNRDIRIPCFTCKHGFHITHC